MAAGSLGSSESPADMVAFARAEDAFDIGKRLGEIIAPTLVIVGERDKVYSEEIFRRTAEGFGMAG